ncbi:hypothetical protein JCM6882_003201 [Rhodosporidiobolus microsporus]
MTTLPPSSAPHFHRHPLRPADSYQSLAAASSLATGNGGGDTPSDEFVSAQSSLRSLTDSSLNRPSSSSTPKPPLSGSQPALPLLSSSSSMKGDALSALARNTTMGPPAGPSFSSSSISSSFASSSSFSTDDDGARSDMSIPRPAGARGPPVPLSSLAAVAEPPSASAEDKENLPSSPVRRSSRAPPFPRPNSPLPALPPSTSQRIRAPPRPSPTTASFPASLTSNTSFAAFKATNPRPPAAAATAAQLQAKRASVGGSGSEDTHRTSSDVDLDFSFDYDPRKDMSREMSLLDDALVEEALSAERDAEAAAEETVVFPAPHSLPQQQQQQHQQQPKHDHLAIPVLRPAEHDIPASHLVRSSSGKLVGVVSSPQRHGRAASAMDLRAQFKAGAMAAGEVAIEMGGEEAYGGELVEEEPERRRIVREGKRPVEGERAASTTLWMGEGPPLVPFSNAAPSSSSPLPTTKASKRLSIGRGFAYNPTDSTLPLAYGGAPRSAPAEYTATFSSQQDQPPLSVLVDEELERAQTTKRTRGAFPLPLKLLADRTKRTATALVSPALSAAASWRSGGGGGRATPTGTVETDAESFGPSPLFDEDVDGTVRTAPSTPNDTPLMQECFDEDDTAHPPQDLPPPVPVPHRLGTSAAAAPAPVGLGFDFGDGRGVDNFPVIPLRQSRRVSLPPDVLLRRRQSLRQYGHQAIPSVAVSPPPPHDRPSEDSTESSSSLATTAESADSAADPTVSPSRRLSRRLSSNASSQPRPVSSVRFDRPPPPPPVTSSALAAHAGELDTPSRSRANDSFSGPSVRTPQHLLATPSTAGGGAKRNLSRSFSFSPAPLRLVKAQLMRAAGYAVAEPQQGPPPALGPEVLQREESDAAIELAGGTDSRAASPLAGSAAARRRTAVWDDLTDLLSSSPATWLDEVVPAKLAFIAGFLLGPWLWVIAGWYLRPLDGELPSTRGKRCRDPACGCGRMLRGSALREHTSASSAYSREKARLLNPQEVEMWAGLDRWVFLNRVAAGGGGVGVTVIVAVAIWAAATA